MPLSKKQQELNNKLIEVCTNGDLSAFKDLIKQGANPKSTTFKFSPLTLAAGNGHLDIVKCLLHSGINIDIFHRLTPISAAANRGYFEVVKYLAEKGANLNGAIQSAVSTNRLDMVKYLYQIGADIKENSDKSVMVAIWLGHLEILKYLVDIGADIHKNDEAIIEASKHSQFEVVKYLHQSGADIDLAIEYATASFKEQLLSYKEKALMHSDVKEGSLKPSNKGSGLRV